jgi:hypothetical protein
MENHSEDPTDYDFKYSVEESLYPHVGCTQITFVRLGEETYEGAVLAKVIKIENNYQTFLSKKQLQPHSRPSKPTYSFTARSEECFRDSAFSPFFANYPVMNTALSVWYPDEALRDRKGIKWIIKRPMLPGQGFVVRWDALNSQIPESVTTTGPAVQKPC